jgi:hypothetical protein
MMATNKQWTEKVVDVLESIYNLFILALNALQTVLESIINALEGIINRFVHLVEVVLKVGFYVAPFVLMVVIGPIKHWIWMTIIGWIIISLVVIIFAANLIGALRGKENQGTVNNPQNLRKLNFTVGLLNFLMIVYSVLYFGVGISAEKELIALFGRTDQNQTANLVREEMYLKLVDPSEKTNSTQYIEAVQELGRLRSTRAVQPLIQELLSIDLTPEIIDEAILNKALLIIDALKAINSPEACTPLIQVETGTSNKQLKERARKAADFICR